MSSFLEVLPAFPAAPLTVAISECLVGGEVRYDGGHKRSSLPHDKLEGLFEFMPLCPEVGNIDSPRTARGRGIYAAEIARQRPDLPLEESGHMLDSVLRENFVTRTFIHAHWWTLQALGLTPKSLIAFDSAYKFLLMAHSIPAYRELGKLLSDLSSGVDTIAPQYFSQLMTALAKPASRGGHANVLSNLQGYVKNQLSSNARRELAELIESYRRDEIPLMAPLALLKHHLDEHEATYARNQLYLQPHPASAGLRRDL